MINRADKAALLPVQKIHSLVGIYTGVYKFGNTIDSKYWNGNCLSGLLGKG